MMYILILYFFVVSGGVVGVCLCFFFMGLVDFWFGKVLFFGIFVVNVVGLFLLVILYGFIECGDLVE